MNRDFYIKSFYKSVTVIKTSFNCILKIMKSLYKMFKIDNHWFFIYHKHHTEKFVITELTYNSCLFHCIKSLLWLIFKLMTFWFLSVTISRSKNTKLSKQSTLWSNSANANLSQNFDAKKNPPVRKSPVSDRSSSEKSSEESAPLRPIENS